MTPQEMRQQKAQAISEAAQGLGWEAEIEIDGFGFVAMLSAKGASGQIVEGKLSKALTLIEDFGGPELYSLVEEYDLVGIKDEAAELDEFVEHEEEKPPSTLDLSDEGLEAMETFIDAADAVCATCTGEDCGVHEDSEFGDGRYNTSPKETWQACQVDDTPQNEYEHQHGGPTLANNPKEVEMSENNDNFVKDAVRTIAADGFVLVARKPNSRRYLFGSISNARGAKYVANGFRFTAEPKAQVFTQ